jgi:hypothetical protein
LGAVAGAVVVGSWWTVQADSVSSWTVERPPSTAMLDRGLRALETASRFLGIGVDIQFSHPAFRAALERIAISGFIAPVVGLATVSATLAGLIVRESARFALRFSSPTLNYLGKRLAATALVAGLALPVLPVAVPPWTTYLAGFLFAMGVGTYVANLPVKL